MVYHIKGTRFLLTWSQVNNGVHEEAFQLLQAYSDVSYARIAKENHKDGGTHWHAAVEFARPIDGRLDRQLDFYGKHPNVNAKNRNGPWVAAVTYCAKDGDYRDFGESTAATSFGLLSSAKSASSFAEYLEQCQLNRVPYGYCQAAWNLLQTASSTLDSGEGCAGEVTSPELRDRVWGPQDKTLILVGPSGIGKTVWAKRNLPRPTLFVSHIDDLKGFQPGIHRSILFDDMCFIGDQLGKGKWPVQSQIHLVDFDNFRSIHCRHVTARIPAGIFKAFTCNEIPLEVDHPAIARRVEVVYCTED